MSTIEQTRYTHNNIPSIFNAPIVLGMRPLIKLSFKNNCLTFPKLLIVDDIVPVI